MFHPLFDMSGRVALVSGAASGLGKAMAIAFAESGADLMLAGAMTDPKGHRAKRPSQQDDPDQFVRVVERRDDGVVIRGAKLHNTGGINSHEVLVMPGTGLSDEESDYAVACAVPANADGVLFIFGRQSNDNRKLEGGCDIGNPRFGVVGGEAMVVFDDVFVPNERVFMLSLIHI